MLSVKVRFGEDVRRFGCEATMDAIVASVRTVFPAAFSGPAPNATRLRFMDDEGDLVDFANDEDLKEALRLIGSGPLRLRLGDAPAATTPTPIPTPTPPLPHTHAPSPVAVPATCPPPATPPVPVLAPGALEPEISAPPVMAPARERKAHAEELTAELLPLLMGRLGVSAEDSQADSELYKTLHTNLYRGVAACRTAVVEWNRKAGGGTDDGNDGDADDEGSGPADAEWWRHHPGHHGPGHHSHPHPHPHHHPHHPFHGHHPHPHHDHPHHHHRHGWGGGWKRGGRHGRGRGGRGRGGRGRGGWGRGGGGGGWEHFGGPPPPPPHHQHHPFGGPPPPPPDALAAAAAALPIPPSPHTPRHWMYPPHPEVATASDAGSPTVVATGSAVAASAPTIVKSMPSTSGTSPVDGPDASLPPPGSHGGQLSARARDVARFIKHVTLPPDTQVLPGQALVKIWRLGNFHVTDAWPEPAELILVNPRAVPDRLGAPATIPVRGGVRPGAEADVTVNLVAPMSPGKYQAYFRLSDASGKRFGHRLTASIVVMTPSDAEDDSDDDSDSDSSDIEETTSPVAATATAATATAIASAPPLPPSTPWSTELALLRDMGFCPDGDTTRPLVLLNEFHGNVERVIAALTGTPDPMPMPMPAQALSSDPRIAKKQMKLAHKQAKWQAKFERKREKEARKIAAKLEKLERKMAKRR